MNRRQISIVGPGKVGAALGILAVRAGWPVTAVGGRDEARTRSAAEAISSETEATSTARAAAAGRLVLLTVSDDAIEPLCRQLAAERAFSRGAVVVHCSGALSSEILSAAREACGCAVGSMHPLQTFPTAAAAIERLAGAYFFCEGDQAALTVMEQFIGHIGGRAVRIASADGRKELYHAGAAMACNHLAAIIDAAQELMAAAGVDRGTSLAALAPLVKATTQNVLAMGPEAALTGPVARGDLETVARHLEAIAGRQLASDLASLYRAAGRWTVALAERKGTIDAPAAKALRRLLAEPGEEK